MGMITVQLAGSFSKSAGFTTGSNSFSAMGHGHADAVARAIEYLASDVLPRAIALDHKLQSEGAKPEGGFDRYSLEGAQNANRNT